MKSLTLKYFVIIFIIFFLPAFYGCPGSGTPKITLTVTDCPVDDITIEHKTRVTTQSGNQWTLNTTITVKCNGQPVNNAEIKVEFWWPGGTFKLTTNEKGEAKKSKRGQGSPPYGQKFTVTVKGNDDEKEVEFEVKRN